jgi:hypothetical protein
LTFLAWIDRNPPGLERNMCESHESELNFLRRRPGKPLTDTMMICSAGTVKDASSGIHSRPIAKSAMRWGIVPPVTRAGSGLVLQVVAAELFTTR